MSEERASGGELMVSASAWASSHTRSGLVAAGVTLDLGENLGWGCRDPVSAWLDNQQVRRAQVTWDREGVRAWSHTTTS